MVDLKLKYTPNINYDKDNNIKFDPPVYQQRYSAVIQILENDIWKNEIKKVVDFGCAELKFCYALKTLSNVEQIVEIDIDDELLKQYGPRTKPLTVDYLKRRARPLKIDIYKGDISLEHECLLNSDAIVGIEVIEHLFPQTLENLPYTIFGYAKPKLVILTTPNCEYNVYFSNLIGFRHDDHKFEWTRQEFEDWANNLCLRYPDYIVQFIGIAPSPPGKENLGCVSQMAVFMRVDFLARLTVPSMSTELTTQKGIDKCESSIEMDLDQLMHLKINESPYSNFFLDEESGEVMLRQTTAATTEGNGEGNTTTDDYTVGKFKFDMVGSGHPDAIPNLETYNNLPDDRYTLIYSYLYPMNADLRSRDKKILDEVNYHISRFRNMEDTYLNYDEGCFEIPLQEVLRYVYRETEDLEELKEILLKASFKIVNDKIILDRFEYDDEDDTSEGCNYDSDMEVDQMQSQGVQNDEAEDAMWG